VQSESRERLRLFVAADVDARLLAHVGELTQELRTSLADARWIPLENQHITLKFLGGTSQELVSALTDVCSSVAASIPKNEVSLSGLGAFPNPKRARVLWVGFADAAGTLARLASALDRGFEPLGFTAEQRAFTPHLTLARFKVPARLGQLPALPAEKLPPVPIDEISLYRSKLSPHGAKYEVIDSFALA
jgi:RNA 2',3'-cyclic 3'-phosphodiesterase